MKRWNIKAHIMPLPSNADPSYHLQGEDGQSFRRDLIHIRPRIETFHLFCKPSSLHLNGHPKEGEM